MIITVIHPSRGRPQQAKQFIAECFQKLSHIHKIHWCVSCDNDEKMEYQKEFDDFFKSMFPEVYLIFNDNKNHVQAVNIAMDNHCKIIEKYALGCSYSDMYIVTGEDWSFPLHWDKKLVDKVPMDKTKWVIAIKDGIQPKMITLPIFSIYYYNEDKFVYHPDFESMYSDNLFSQLAYSRNVVIEARDLYFEHKHYTVKKSKLDKTYQEHTSPERYKRGKETFDRLMKQYNLKDIL